LLVGLNSKDDAAVYRVTDDLAAIQTVDFLTPIVDDAFTFGRIAAATALSDIYAMGVKPDLVLNLLCFNSAELELETANDILAGGADAIIESGAVLAGGQTNEDSIPKYGLCVTAFAPIGKILTNSGAKPGDVIILSKAIGTGVIMAALRANSVSEDAVNSAISQMCRLNKYAAEALEGFEVHACTDVTGFGLAGHLLELANASGVTVEIDYSAVPKLPQVNELSEKEYFPCKAYDNLKYIKENLSTEGIEAHKVLLLTDPQTSGGLLFCLPEDKAQAALENLKKHDPDSAVIGRVTVRGNHAILVIG